MAIDDYVPILRKFGVSTVIRLNKKVYDRRRFVDQGVAHYDLYFIDGTCPSLPILDRFINICETHKGTMTLHLSIISVWSHSINVVAI
jgi:cell division cycle 14